MQPYGEWLVGPHRNRLLVLLGAVACVLLIVCANVANLLLAHGATREIAVRVALGAGRSRIVEQLLAESWVLALAGAAGGLAIAFASVRLLVAAAPLAIPRLEQTEIDPAALAFTFALALACSVLFALAPALVASRPGLQDVLKEGHRFDAPPLRGRRLRLVTPGVFATLRIPLKEGRLFGDDDRAGAPKVMIVSESLGRQAWPGESAVGKGVACCEGSPEEPSWKRWAWWATFIRAGRPRRLAPSFTSLSSRHRTPPGIGFSAP
jgi:hypothetical protein